ncbi:hypothetical protein M8C21_002150 [Ambrosia artemisiifolia]|uniref:Uncharacterized protein n=1 Tax=Ambrosia artemisiifolia TaxID=4212 RepID=A0AAD5G7P9_AMBAR|nr:hypothetical protein M8C21_002150 [Ambrosia artemisiifolia]
MNMERRSIFQERVLPSPLSSSLYYGGQEDILRKWTGKMILIICTVHLEEIGGKEIHGHLIEVWSSADV